MYFEVIFYNDVPYIAEVSTVYHILVTGHR